MGTCKQEPCLDKYFKCHQTHNHVLSFCIMFKNTHNSIKYPTCYHYQTDYNKRNLMYKNDIE